MRVLVFIVASLGSFGWLVSDEVAVPRAQLLADANRAYAQQTLESAIDLYEQVLNTPPSEEESATTSAAIDGVASFREVIGLAATGHEEEARLRLAALVERDPDGPLARLATQFWDQYGMTVSARAACAQLAPQLATQASTPLNDLRSLGVEIGHDELCTLPHPG